MSSAQGLVRAARLWPGAFSHCMDLESWGTQSKCWPPQDRVSQVQAHLCLHPRPVYEGLSICCQPAHSHANVLINLGHLFDAGGLLQAFSILELALSNAVQLCSCAALMVGSCRDGKPQHVGQNSQSLWRDRAAVMRSHLHTTAFCAQQLLQCWQAP